MVLMLWEGTPNFATDQVVSASGHLNALGMAANLVFDRVTGYGAPFSGVQANYVLGDPVITTWAIRHRSNTFDYRLTVDGHCWITYNGVKLASTEKYNGIYSGSVDLSSLGLTFGQFYELTFVVASGSATLWLMQERLVSTFPTLVSFANGTTPTAAQWNDLSAYAELLNTETSLPKAPFAGVLGGPPNQYGGRVLLWCGSLVHRSSLLGYRITVESPYNQNDGGGWLNQTIISVESDTVSETDVATLSNSQRAAQKQEFVGQADLSGTSLVIGETYRIRVYVNPSQGWDTFKGCEVSFLREVSESSPSLSGWTTPPTWNHGDYVAGVNTLRDSLVSLRSGYIPVSYPVMRARASTRNADTWKFEKAFRAQRQMRFLHYKCATKQNENDPTPSPKITYQAFGEERSATLAWDETGAWGVFDLAAQEALYVGTEYSISEALFAIEDDSA